MQQHQDAPVFPAYLRPPTITGERGPFAWWYRLTLPAPPPEDAELAQREAARRARLASSVLLALLAFCLLTLLQLAFGSTPEVIELTLVTFAVEVIAVILNRLRQTIVAGLLIIIWFEVNTIINFIVVTHGVASYDQLVESVMIAVCFLPAVSVFGVGAVNSLIIALLTTIFNPVSRFGTVHAGGLASYEQIVRPAIVQVIITIVTYLWARSASRAIARADRAEVIAALEHAVADREHMIAEQKRQLEQGIEKILQTHVRVANGNFSARAPAMQENVLAQVATSLNHLLARLQRSLQAEYHVQAMQAELARLAEAIRRVKAKKEPLREACGGTPVDSIIVELSGSHILSSYTAPERAPGVVSAHLTSSPEEE